MGVQLFEREVLELCAIEQAPASTEQERHDFHVKLVRETFAKHGLHRRDAADDLDVPATGGGAGLLRGRPFST